MKEYQANRSLTYLISVVQGKTPTPLGPFKITFSLEQSHSPTWVDVTGLVHLHFHALRHVYNKPRARRKVSVSCWEKEFPPYPILVQRNAIARNYFENFTGSINLASLTGWHSDFERHNFRSLASAVVSWRMSYGQVIVDKFSFELSSIYAQGDSKRCYTQMKLLWYFVLAVWATFWPTCGYR